MYIRNHFKIHENRSTIYQYFVDATKVRRTFGAQNDCIRKEERTQINDLTFPHKELGEESQLSPHLFPSICRN